MIRSLLTLAVLAATFLLGPAGASAEPLVLYSGRSKALVQPIIEQFTAATGIEVEVRYGDTAQLAVALKEEGARSPADVFWSQDAGALGALVAAGRLAPLPEDVLAQVAEAYRSPTGQWIATSGRARTLAYAPDRVAADELPDSVFDLTDPKWKGRVGWAPANGSFQAFVTALRKTHGDDRARQWLLDMKANGARAYPKNSTIVQAIAAGEIDLGLPNHYYLLRFKDDDPDFPVEQTLFAAGDIGNLVNVAGVGILNSSDASSAARQFVQFLLSPQAQRYFATETFEYPVIEGVEPDPRLPDRTQLKDKAPRVDLDTLEDLEGTIRLLQDVGVL